MSKQDNTMHSLTQLNSQKMRMLKRMVELLSRVLLNTSLTSLLQTRKVDKATELTRASTLRLSPDKHLMCIKDVDYTPRKLT